MELVKNESRLWDLIREILDSFCNKLLDLGKNGEDNIVWVILSVNLDISVFILVIKFNGFFYCVVDIVKFCFLLFFVIRDFVDWYL